MTFQKTYLSRAITRAMALDHPVGDPLGGAAYGEMNDPVSAVVAIGTMAGTATAAAGVIAGTFTLATISAGLAFAGAAMSLVGNISGDANLMKYGAITGLAGGLGMAIDAVGQWAAAKTAETAAQTGAQSAPLAGTPTTTPTPVVDGVMQAANDAASAGQAAVNATNQNVLNSPMMGGSGAPASTAPASAVPVETGLTMSPLASASTADSSLAMASGGEASTGLAGGYNSVANPAQAGQEGFGWQYFTDEVGRSVAIDPQGRYFLGGQQVTGAGGQAMGFGDYASQVWGGIKGAGQGILDFTKGNPEGAKLLSGVIGGGLDYATGKTGAQIAQLQADAAYRQAAAAKLQREIDLEKERRARLNAGYQQVNSVIPVNPTAQITPVNPYTQFYTPGIVQQAMG